MVYAPKVSIVIPVYNGGNFLGEAIDSALAQTYKNTEILVVNDGSNDAGQTERVALAYGKKIRYLSKQNGGVASALNRAIAELSGEFYSWLSHDDLYCKEKVENQINVLARIGQDKTIIYSDYSVFFNDPSEAYPVRMKGVPPEQFRAWITVENTLHGCTLLIPRSAFEECGIFNENLRTTQDYDLWFRLAEKYRFVHIAEVLVKARSHPGQGSVKNAGIALNECDVLLTGFVNNLKEEEVFQFTNLPLAAAYKEISTSMWKRGFKEAAIAAEKLAESNMDERNSARVGMKNSFTNRRIQEYMIGSARRYYRRYFSPEIRLAVKSILHRAGILWHAGSYAKDGQSLKGKFSEVYDKNLFMGRVSRSGEGSDLIQTQIIRQELPRIIKEFWIKILLDAPCGDWHWMRETQLGDVQYFGIDIVDSIIEKNIGKFGKSARQFLCLNLAQDILPKADLIFCRDCLVHLSFHDAFKIIDNFKRSGAKYLLTTTFVNRNQNNDLVGIDRFWRALNMEQEPFNFPKPLLIVNEGCTEEDGLYKDKSLGLWLLQDITCDCDICR